MELKIDPDWLLRMAEKENGCSISVGGLYSRFIQASQIEELKRLEKYFGAYNCRRLRKKWKRYQLQKRKQ